MPSGNLMHRCVFNKFETEKAFLSYQYLLIEFLTLNRSSISFGLDITVSTRIKKSNVHFVCINKTNQNKLVVKQTFYSCVESRGEGVRFAPRRAVRVTQIRKAYFYLSFCK